MVSKNCMELLRKLEKKIVVARRREYFWGFLVNLFIAGLPQKKKCLIHKNSLAFCQLVSSQHWVTHSDVSFQTKLSECLVTVELTLHIYFPVSDILPVFKANCSPPPLSHWVTWIVSIEALLFTDDRDYGSSHSFHGVHAHPVFAVRNRWRLCQVKTTIDWCCFYHYIRNSSVTLPEALFAPIISRSEISVFYDHIFC